MLAVVFGIIGIRRKARKGFAITGLATGAVAIVFAIIGLAIVNKATNDLNSCFDAISKDARNGTQTADAACSN